MFERKENQNITLAVDIGGSKIEITIINDNGELIIPVEKFKVPFNNKNIADPKKLINLIKPFAEKAKKLSGNLCGLGLSVCGNINQNNGTAILVPNLHWRNIPFGEMVKKELEMPVFAATDVRMALLGEYIWGAAKGKKYFAWVTIGTGYGGYLFLNGEPYEGVHGFAGNNGHVTWNEIDGEQCGCGNKGCFETFVAGPAIAREGQKAAESMESPYLANILMHRKITTKDVFDGEIHKDEKSHSIIENIIRLICINLGGMVNILDIDLIILGGGVIKGNKNFIPRINTRVRDFLMTDEAKRDLKIVKESFNNSALVGAAADVFIRQQIINR